MRVYSLESVLLQALWEEAIEIVANSETRARLIGVKIIVETFLYFFGLVLGERILKHTDNLTKSLQNPSLTASEVQQVAELTCQTLERIRTAEAFDLFWKNVMLLQKQKGVNEPVLPRMRKAPPRFEVGSGIGHHPNIPKDLFH